MYMVMVVIAVRRRLICFVGADLRVAVSMIVIVLVAVMPEMCGVARSVLQSITNTHHRRVGGVQR